MEFLSVNVEASETSKNTNLLKENSNNNVRNMFLFLPISKDVGGTRENEKMKVDTKIVKM